MPVRAMITGITLVLLIFFLVYSVEHFIPLSVKADVDMVCRGALLKMERSGGLSSEDREELRVDLESRGLADIAISATSDARQGGLLTLYVEGSFHYNRITDLFKREDVTLRMVYDKSSYSRRVVN